ncbi:MAG: VCBS repeat-containing protein, partial [Phycisphaerales bacterium]|nr:VCBS repeat-containing protein [Phycisphaerales bacterium]
QGDFTQVGGRIVVPVGGNPSSPEAGVLDVTGAADLAGGIVVNFNGSVPTDPAVLDGLSVLSAPSINGRFEVGLMPPLTSDPMGNIRLLRIAYPGDGRGSGDVSLVVATISGGQADLDVQLTGQLAQQPVAAAMGDVGQSDGIDTGPPDGVDDLVVVFADGGGVVLYNRSGGFEPTGASLFDLGLATQPTDIAVGDVNADTAPDIVTSNRGSDDVAVLLNSGLGLFPSDYRIALAEDDDPAAIALGDLNNDGRPEVLTANAGSDSFACVGNTGGASPAGWDVPDVQFVGREPSDITVASIDTDKWDDPIVALRGDNRIGIIPNTGMGVLGMPVYLDVGNGPVRMIADDLDGDSWIDLATINAEDQSVSIIRSSGPAISDLNDSTELPLPGIPGSFAAVDFNNDGALDLALAVDDALVFLRNDLVLTTSGEDLIFTDVTGDPGLPDVSGPRILLRGDVNGSGTDDLVVVNDGSGAELQRGVTTSRVRVFLPICPGDADGSGSIDFDDLNLVLGNWGTTGPAGDVFPVPDGDGAVNFDDLNLVLGSWGITCN